MENSKKLKLMGGVMCLPALVMAIYLVFHLGFFLVAALTAVSTALCVYGIKFIKGESLADIKKDLVDDYRDLINKKD